MSTVCSYGCTGGAGWGGEGRDGQGVCGVFEQVKFLCKPPTYNLARKPLENFVSLQNYLHPLDTIKDMYAGRKRLHLGMRKSSKKELFLFLFMLFYLFSVFDSVFPSIFCQALLTTCVPRLPQHLLVLPVRRWLGAALHQPLHQHHPAGGPPGLIY